MAETQAAPIGLLDVATIYHEPAVPDYPRGRQILDRFPDAERVIVRSHWNIPGPARQRGSRRGLAARQEDGARPGRPQDDGSPP